MFEPVVHYTTFFLDLDSSNCGCPKFTTFSSMNQVRGNKISNYNISCTENYTVSFIKNLCVSQCIISLIVKIIPQLSTHLANKDLASIRCQALCQVEKIQKGNKETGFLLLESIALVDINQNKSTNIKGQRVANAMKNEYSYFQISYRCLIQSIWWHLS